MAKNRKKIHGFRKIREGCHQHIERGWVEREPEKEVGVTCIGKHLYLGLRIHKSSHTVFSTLEKTHPLRRVSSPPSLAPSRFVSGSFTAVKKERGSYNCFISALTGKTGTTVAIIGLVLGTSIT